MNAVSIGTAAALAPSGDFTINVISDVPAGSLILVAVSALTEAGNGSANVTDSAGNTYDSSDLRLGASFDLGGGENEWCRLVPCYNSLALKAGDTITVGTIQNAVNYAIAASAFYVTGFASGAAFAEAVSSSGDSASVSSSISVLAGDFVVAALSVRGSERDTFSQNFAPPPSRVGIGSGRKATTSEGGNATANSDGTIDYFATITAEPWALVLAGFRAA